MRFPWQQKQDEPIREVRENSPFTDAVVTGILRAVGGESQPGDTSAIAGLETAAGLFARAFAAAKVSPQSAYTEGLTPFILALIGRELVRRGECVLVPKMTVSGLRLVPAGTWDVRGGYDENDWTYRVDLFGASEHVSELLPSRAVIHLRYAVDPVTPWIGLSPLQWARLTGTLAANLEQRLGEEASAPVGQLLPIPQDGGADATEDDADPLAGLKADLKKLRGNTALVETTAAGWGEGQGSAPQADWKPRRMGADPPAALGELYGAAGREVLNVCGIPVSLATDADGTSQRESWRRFIMGAVEPVAGIIADELSRKLETPISFDFSRLWAHDLAGRAQAFKGLVAGGMALEDAARISGVMGE